jgi:glycine/D-amino acid oxidase-like deaminating enzyme
MSALLNNEIAILGAGVIGLTTAYRLIEIAEENHNPKLQRLNITIIADSFNKETTSGN